MTAARKSWRLNSQAGFEKNSGVSHEHNNPNSNLSTELLPTMPSVEMKDIDIVIRMTEMLKCSVEENNQYVCLQPESQLCAWSGRPSRYQAAREVGKSSCVVGELWC